MNSSDEEKQLQLITSLKEQGRRARGRQVRAAAARGRGRLRGAGFGAGCAAAAGSPAAPLPGEKHPSRPARIAEPTAKGNARALGSVRPGRAGSAPRWFLRLVIGGLGTGARIRRGHGPTVLPSAREKRVGLIFGGRSACSAQLASLPGLGPTLARWRWEACRAALQPSQLFILVLSSSSFST